MHLRPHGLGCCTFKGSGSVDVDLLFYKPPIVWGVPCWSLFWYALLYIHSSVAIILTRKRELVTLFYCLLDALLL